MSLPPLLRRFSRDQVIDAAWNQVIITTSLRHDATWNQLRHWLKGQQGLKIQHCICTGLGQVENGLGVYLLTSDRRLVYGEFEEVNRTACINISFESEHLIDAESSQEMVAVYFQSTDECRETFDGMVTHCRRHDQEFKVKLGDRYQEAALLMTDSYLDFHRDWLMPELEQLFPST